MEERDKSLDIREFIGILSKRFWLILFVTLMATSTTGFISIYLLKPQYEASAEILVNQAKSEETVKYSHGDILTDIGLINTYNVVIKSSRILDQVIKDYHLNKTYEELIDQIKVHAVSNSQVMSITVIDSNHKEAVYIANAIAKTFQQEIQELMYVDNVHIMSEAKEVPYPIQVKPKPYLNMAIAFVIGIMTGICLTFLIEYIDNTLKTEEDVEQVLGLYVIGVISKMDYKTEQKLKQKLLINQSIGGEKLEQ
jgi:capsular polysaccharide biosynthesis protein